MEEISPLGIPYMYPGNYNTLLVIGGARFPLSTVSWNFMDVQKLLITCRSCNCAVPTHLAIFIRFHESRARK